jgi:hypothetical protein
MTTSDIKPRRIVTACRLVALGTLAATTLGGVAHAGTDTATWSTTEAPGQLLLAAAADDQKSLAAHAEGGEGGEGAEGAEGGEGGSALSSEVSLMRDLGFMTGHLRAGMALYEAGDLKAAKTHMGHPIEEKYDAVAEPLQKRGFGSLKARLVSLSTSVEDGASVEKVRRLFDEVIAGVDDVRKNSPGSPGDQLMGLAALTRVAADEYRVAIADDGSIRNLHEYQDSWGFLRTVEREAKRWAANDDAGIAAGANKILEQVNVVKSAYGDLQGSGIKTPDSNLIYGAAARMELAVIAID